MTRDANPTTHTNQLPHPNHSCSDRTTSLHIGPTKVPVVQQTQQQKQSSNQSTVFVTRGRLNPASRRGWDSSRPKKAKASIQRLSRTRCSGYTWQTQAKTRNPPARRLFQLRLAHFDNIEIRRRAYLEPGNMLANKSSFSICGGAFCRNSITGIVSASVLGWAVEPEDCVSIRERDIPSAGDKYWFLSLLLGQGERDFGTWTSFPRVFRSTQSRCMY